MQSSTVILTNKSGTSKFQTPSVAHVKYEPTDDSVLMLSDSKDDIFIFVDLIDILLFRFRSVYSTLSQLLIHVAKSLCSPMYGRLVHQFTPSQHSPLYPLPSSIGLTIVDVLKLTKLSKKSM